MSDGYATTVLSTADMAAGVQVLYGRRGSSLYITVDPTQITNAAARDLVAEAISLYPSARAVALTDVGRTVVMDLPPDGLPVRIEQDDRGCTVTYDDTRITSGQLLGLLERAGGEEL